MKTTLWSFSKVRPYERNPRINDDAVEAVARSIERFGFRQPIVVDRNGTIIAGHTRWKAAQKLGLKKVPVHVAEDLTPEEIQAYRLADNKLGELARWDLELLGAELADLAALDFDLELLGFSDDELAGLLQPEAKEGLTDPDWVPEPPEKAITQPGDLWLLGEHRLLCGDAGNPEDVDRLLDGAPVHLVNTDPPYGVRVEPRSNNAIAAGNSSFPGAGKRRTHHQAFDRARLRPRKPTTPKLRPKDRPLANDFLAPEEFDRLLHAWFGQMARVLEPGRTFYIWGGYANLANYPPVLEACGLYFSQAIVWDKAHPVLTRKDFMGSFELAFYGWKQGARHRFFGPNNAVDLWHVKKVSPQKMTHLTEKPVELAERALGYSSRPGEGVFDPFAGSGSTFIAAEQTSRRAYLMELDALYCDVAVQRYERFTGRKAKRQSGTTPRRRRRGA